MDPQDMINTYVFKQFQGLLFPDLSPLKNAISCKIPTCNC